MTKPSPPTTARVQHGACERQQESITRALLIVKTELEEAYAKHGDFNSYHEGYAVILEELDEMWDEIKKRSKDDSSIWFEATQVSAMGVKLMMFADRKMHPQ